MQRSRSTIYQWIDAGKVRTMRPLRVMWLNLPDLLTADATTRPGRPKRKEEDVKDA